MYSRGYRTSGDGYINAVNFLQKFDSKVLTIDTGVTDAKLDRGYGKADERQPWFAWYVGFADPAVNKEGETPGTAKWLYAADPLWPEGYDTNSKETRSFTKGGRTYNYTPAQRMAFAQEEDLIYFTSLADLQAAGYTCIGVLMEVRKCSLEAGSNYPTMRVAMKVLPDAANIGKTVSTTAIVRNWLDDGGSMSDISWQKGSANNMHAAAGRQTAANTLTDGAGQKITDLAAYGNCVALTQGSGPEANKLYVKSEYQDGNIVTGTHYNGYTWGMSVLIIGYKSYLDIGVTNVKDGSVPGDAGNLVFEIDKGEWTAEYTISNIHTEAIEDTPQQSTTNLKLTAAVPTASKVGANDGLTLIASSFKIAAKDSSGNMTYKSIGVGEANAVPFTVTHDGVEYLCLAYVEIVSEGRASIYLKNVPLRAMLPDIVFDAEIGAGVQNTAELTASAVISGDQDTRAQTADNGNYVTESIKISTLSSSALTKKVAEALIELDEKIHYTIVYSNTSNSAAIEKMYLYDLMPYNGDIRGSGFDGSVEATGISAYLSDTEGNPDTTFTAYARFYYSTVPPEKLKNILGETDFDNMPETDGIYLQELLDNALVDTDGNVCFFLDENDDICDLYEYTMSNGNEQISGAKFTVDPTTRYVKEVNAGQTKFVRVTGVAPDGAGGFTLTSEDVKFASDPYKKLFRHYGYIDGNSGSTEVTQGVGADEEEEFGRATCIFARVTKLSPARTLNIGITVDTAGNKAADIYGNKAHSMIAGTTSRLSSNTVWTNVVSREISGVVWYDRNLNGIRDDGEPTLPGVTATLFRKDGDTYVECAAGVGNTPIAPLITGADGAYQFERLAAGEYIVAFAGEGLKQYTAAAAYQQGQDMTRDNDGVAIKELPADGIAGDYAYAIKFSAEKPAVRLRTLAEIAADDAGFAENYTNLDLGLVITGSAMPETGGRGTAAYTAGGLVLVGGAAAWLWARRQKWGFKR